MVEHLYGASNEIVMRAANETYQHGPNVIILARLFRYIRGNELFIRWPVFANTAHHIIAHYCYEMSILEQCRIPFNHLLLISCEINGDFISEYRHFARCMLGMPFYANIMST